MYFRREFWLGDNGALVRAIRTWAQTAAAMIAAAAFSPFDIGQWRNVAIVSITSAVMSLLMSLDRRESLLTPPPTTKPVPANPVTVTADPAPDYTNPASATYQPEFMGDLR